MKDGRRLLPEGWQIRILMVTGGALAGNLLLSRIPWSDRILSSYESSVSMEGTEPVSYLLTTLLLAPVVEEGIFRLFLFDRILRGRMGFFGAAVLSSLAFGMYHGNWIQGVYASGLGMILAWGYESSEQKQYQMAVVMHGAANLAAMLLVR